jgi:hypothetical protein
VDSVRHLSLVDLVGKVSASWYVCYCNRENPTWWNRFLKEGYQHVQLRKPFYFGPELDDVSWIVLDPGLSHLDVSLRAPGAAPWLDPEVLHAQRVEVAVNPRRVREWFSFGPITCVEIAKTIIGINSWRVRTPWQLFNHLRQRGCVVER